MENKINSDFKEVTQLSISEGVATFRCATHNEKFSIDTNELHSSEAACPKCNEILKTTNHNELIKKVSGVFSFNFDYSLFQKVGIHTDSVIICPNHGIQKISLKNHLTGNNGHGCPLCCLEFTNKVQRNSTEVNNNWMNQAVKSYITTDKKVRAQTNNNILSA